VTDESLKFERQDFFILFVQLATKLKPQSAMGLIKDAPREPWHLTRSSDGLEAAFRDVAWIDGSATSRREDEVLGSYKLIAALQVTQDRAKPVRHGNKPLAASRNRPELTSVPLTPDGDCFTGYPFTPNRLTVVR